MSDKTIIIDGKEIHGLTKEMIDNTLTWPLDIKRDGKTLSGKFVVNRKEYEEFMRRVNDV